MTAFVGRGSGVVATSASWAQRGVSVAEAAAPHNTAYRICRAYQISGAFDVYAIRAAWRTIVDRHAIMRSTLLEVDGRLTRRVAAASRLSLTYLDLGHVPEGERESRADRFVLRAATEPIDLAVGPLARLGVLRLTPSVHRVVLVLHRAIADERSADILIAELSAAYAGTPLSEQAPQYGDSGPGRTADVRWWTAALAPLPAAPLLPVDRDRPGEPAASGAEVLFTCAGPATLADLVAAVQALLHRYGTASPMAIGVLVPARDPAVVGPCEDILVITGEVTGAQSFRSLAERAAQTVRAALDHRDVPFARVAGALGVAVEPGRIPLCDVLLVLRDTPNAAFVVAGADVRSCTPDLGGAPTRLTLTVRRLAPTVTGRIAFHPEEFDRETVWAFADQLHSVLTAALAAPGSTVDALPLAKARQLRELERGADAITAARIAAAPVHESVRRHAATNDPAEAVDGVTYGELEDRTVAIARRLRRIGVEGRAVVVQMPTGAWQVAASLAVLRAGGQLVWFGTADPGERGRIILDEVRPACLLRDGGTRYDALAAWHGGPVVDVTAILPESRSSDAERSRNGRGPRWLEVPAYVAYTSGSTGRPKGIVQSHGALAQFVEWFAGAFGLGPGSRVAQWVAPEHDPALCEVFATLVAGGTLCPVPPRIRAHPEKFMDWLAAERITFLQTVPSFARELVGVLEQSDVALRPAHLDRLVLMGEALPPDLVNRFHRALPGARLANIYGPTETIAATWCDIDGDVDGVVPIGRSIPGRHVLVLDAYDRPCPTGITGEIVIRSPYVAAGYLGAGHDTAAFRRLPGDGERCYRTGDLARRRWNGVLEFRGRRDHQIKLYGTRVEIGEVESVLAEHDTVAECAVVPLTDDDGLAVQLVAFVVPRPASAGGPAAWRAHLRRRFGASMALVSFRAMPGPLPRNLGGKVDRRRLPPPEGVSDARRSTAAPSEQTTAELSTRR